MRSDHTEITRETIKKEFETARSEFHELLSSLSDEDLKRRSLNPGWTNGEILFHVTFGFMILSSLAPMARFWGRLPPSYSKAFAAVLNAFTGLFNWTNAFGARTGGRAFRGKNIGRRYDRTYASLMRKLNSAPSYDWHRGMYYPTKWDSLFKEYMTLEDVLRYPVIHFRFHRAQISRSPVGEGTTPK